MDLENAREIVAEYKARLDARDNLLSFILYMNPEYIVNWHHRAICDRLSRLRHESGKKLMIFLAPQRGKSEIVSRNFPSWWLGHFPGSKNIMASYSGDLADSFNRDVQSKIAEPRWSNIFPNVVTGKHSAGRNLRSTQNELTTADGGYLYSVGVGGSTTGRSAGAIGSSRSNVQKGFFLVDDPIKDFSDANSPTKIETRWQWWQAVVNTRVHSTSHTILMHTRWSTRDIAGTILADEALREGWEILSFPELGPDLEYPNEYDPRTSADEPLWPEEKGDYAALQKIKTSVGSHTWSALYQQKPVVEGGNIIKEDWIQYYTELPFDLDNVRSVDIVQSWDLTFKETRSGSYVVGVTLIRHGGNIYLVDYWRQRADIIRTQWAIKKMSDSWPMCNRILIEEKANGSAILSLLKDQVSGMIPVKPDCSKDERLMSVQPLFEAGNFYLPANNPKSKEIVEELTTFPSAPHDDIVDAISQGLNSFSKLRGLARLKASVM